MVRQVKERLAGDEGDYGGYSNPTYADAHACVRTQDAPLFETSPVSPVSPGLGGTRIWRGCVGAVPFTKTAPCASIHPSQATYPAHDAKTRPWTSQAASRRARSFTTRLGAYSRHQVPPAMAAEGSG